MKFLRNLHSKWKINKAEKAAFSGTKKYLFIVNLDVKKTAETQEVYLPLPIETGYQKVEDLKFTSQPDQIFKDDNYYLAYWKLLEQQQITVSVKVAVEPREESVRGKLSDYKTSSKFTDFLDSDYHFNFTDQRIKSLAEELKKSNEVEEVGLTFYNYVSNNLNYGNPVEDLYTSIEALTKAKVDCGGFDTLLGAMLRSVGIPARLVSGFWTYNSYMHAWIEFLTPEGFWLPLDPSIENLRKAQRDFKPGGFGKIGNDRIVTSVGSDFNINGKNFSLLQMPVTTNETLRTIKINEIS